MPQQLALCYVEVWLVLYRHEFILYATHCCEQTCAYVWSSSSTILKQMQ